MAWIKLSLCYERRAPQSTNRGSIQGYIFESSDRYDNKSLVKEYRNRLLGLDLMKIR